MVASLRNLLLAGTLSWPMPRPMPHGASRMYFFMASWLMVRTFDDASFLLKADLMRRICWLPLPMFVKTRRMATMANMIEKGMAILNDFDRMTYEARPAPRHAIAVRVPEENMPQMTRIARTPQRIRSLVSLDVMPKMTNAVAVAAALQP